MNSRGFIYVEHFISQESRIKFMDDLLNFGYKVEMPGPNWPTYEDYIKPDCHKWPINIDYKKKSFLVSTSITCLACACNAKPYNFYTEKAARQEIFGEYKDKKAILTDKHSHHVWCLEEEESELSQKWKGNRDGIYELKMK